MLSPKFTSFTLVGCTPGRCENLFEAPENLRKRFLQGAIFPMFVIVNPNVIKYNNYFSNSRIILKKLCGDNKLLVENLPSVEILSLVKIFIEDFSGYTLVLKSLSGYTRSVRI